MIEGLTRCTVRWVFRTIALMLAAWLPVPQEDARAGTRRDDVDDSSCTSLATQADFQSVGKVMIAAGTASGVLISSQWVLTAAHLVSFPNPSSVSFQINGDTYTADEWFAHPSWDGGIGDNGFDIGLVHLDTPVTDVTPAVRYSESSELGAVATIVGYGNTGTGVTGQQSGTSGTKRAGNNVLDVLGSNADVHDNYVIADFDNPNSVGDSSFGSSTPLALEYSAAPGDSGGGAFIDDGGTQRLAGIISFGEDGPVASPDGVPNSDYGDLMGFTRVSILNDWIDQNVGAMGGDYNQDGTIDAADFVVSRKLDGQTGVGLAADGNGDQAVTDLDYGVWKSNFGELPDSGASPTSAPSLQPVPEPASLLLILLVFATVVQVRLRR